MKPENIKAIEKHLEENKQVIFVSSYPRSGNTWVRNLLSDILLQKSNFQTNTNLPIHPDKIIPDIYANLISDREFSTEDYGLFVKTHENYYNLQKTWESKLFNTIRHISI